jgi:hypothetical protein
VKSTKEDSEMTNGGYKDSRYAHVIPRNFMKGLALESRKRI